ncbi:MAG TPA: thiamine pyrophosphate-binding protein [Bacteroidales bacterium]|nr:thiamine pyrophosphate-binding protein [Bacteroidales bacterium]
MSNTVASILARRLKEHGVKNVFGIPGGASIPYIEKMREEGIRFVLTSHESAAAVMADVTARLTGVTGVCHGTFGPGATNLLTGVGGAMLDRSPVIALTSVMSDRWVGRTAQMNIDHTSLFKPVTKASFRLNTEDADMTIRKALSIANSEYPGPVHLGLPDDISGLETQLSGTVEMPQTETVKDDVLTLMSHSSSPVIAIGLTAARLGLGKKILELLEKNPVPVVVTPMARGVIPHQHPCYAGVLFHALSDRLKMLTGKADLIIGLGYDPVEYNYESWMPDVPLVHFSTRVTDLPSGDTLKFISKPEQWFDQLQWLKSNPEMILLAGEVRKSVNDALSGSFPGLSPVDAFNILNDTLPGDSILTADVGSHLHLLGQMWKTNPGGEFLMTNGWSSMGFGIPAAIAAAINRPGRTVVCVTGDGGFAMSAGELLTARRNGLRIIFLVLADGELNLIKLKEQKRAIGPLAVDLYKDNLFSADCYLGIKVLYADNAEKLTRSLRSALGDKGPVIIEAAIDPSAYSHLVVTQ